MSHDKCVCLRRRGLEGHHQNIITSYLYPGGVMASLHLVIEWSYSGDGLMIEIIGEAGEVTVSSKCGGEGGNYLI